MSTVDQYAASTIEKYRVAADPESTSHRAADEVIPLIKQWGKQYLQDIKRSGAYAKNTAVSLSSDVDVLITLNPVPGQRDQKHFLEPLRISLGPRSPSREPPGFDSG